MTARYFHDEPQPTEPAREFAATVADAQVGQMLWLTNAQSGRHAWMSKVVVKKRGRSLLTLSDGRTVRMSDGRDSRHTSSTPGPAWYVFTETERLDKERRSSAVERVAAHGLLDRYALGRWTTDRLTALAEWLEANP